MYVIKDQVELMGFLKSAEEYRTQKITQFRAELEKAQVSARVWRSTISEWENLIPVDVMRRCEEQKRRTEYESECNEEDNRSKEREAAFERAVSQAKGSGKGLLLNDSGNKFLMLPTYCSVIGMCVAVDVVKFHLGFHGEIVAWLSVVVGAALGIVLGIVIFQANFIEAPE